VSVYALDKLIAETRRLAAEYRRSTGQALPVSGEIARYDAARLLDLTLCEPRVGAVDALGQGEREGQRIQIKARMLSRDGKSGARIGQLNAEGDWDTVMLVILDTDYEPCEIYETSREEIVTAMEDSANSHRKRRGALSVAKFKIISRLAWTREDGPEEELWSNR